jgi:hypothetical protein
MHFNLGDGLIPPAAAASALPSRRAFAWAALAASALAVLLASMPFWLPRAVDDTPLEFDGTSRIVGVGMQAFLLSGAAALALGLCALLLPPRVCGARDAWSVVLAILALLPAAALLLLLLGLGMSNLDY